MNTHVPPLTVVDAPSYRSVYPPRPKWALNGPKEYPSKVDVIIFFHHYGGVRNDDGAFSSRELTDWYVKEFLSKNGPYANETHSGTAKEAY